MKARFPYQSFPTIKLVLLLIFSFFLILTSDAQFPHLKASLKDNLYKISCLDDFELVAQQVNWQTVTKENKEFIFQNLHFTSAQKGYALAYVRGNGVDKYFIKTTDGGETWNYDPAIKQDYIAHMQFFGKDSVVLLGKQTIDYYVDVRFRYFSKDGGATWTIVSSNMTVDPVVTHFVNASVGYSVDAYDGFLMTTDGGSKWVKQSEVAIGFKKDLLCLSSNNIFLLYDNGLYRSADRGKSWRKILLPLNHSLTDLCMMDSIGFISARLGIILKTEDGGETWKTANDKVFPNLLKIGMLSRDSVFAVGNLSTILFSADAGNTWHQQHADKRTDLYDINIYDRKQIKAGGLFGLLQYYPTVNLSGYEWEPDHLILSSNGNRAIGNAANDAWISVSAKDAKGNPYSGNILIPVDSPGLLISSDSVADNRGRLGLHATTDAGTWGLHKEEFINVFYHDLAKINQDTAFIGGQYDSFGLILKTTDGGEHWMHCHQNLKYRIDDIEFAGSKVGYAGGYLGYLIKTIDGGDHWEELTSPTKEDIKSISFVDELTGFLAADYGQVYKTTDGGKTWEYSYVRYDHPRKILFLDHLKGFLLHNYSGFLRTVDGGKTWQEVPHDKFFDVMDITFVNENVGYTCGSMLGPFTFMKTVDGGKTWIEKIFPRWTSTTYKTISFKDEYNGFVFNALGEIIATGDGGLNWYILDTLKYNEPNTYGSYGFPVNSFQFMNNNRAVGVGNGQIVHHRFSPEIRYSWYPNSEMEQSETAHPKVPVNLYHTYDGAIFRNSFCETFLRFEMPSINVLTPALDGSSVSVYPQPVSDQLFIESFELPDFDTVKFFDMNGKLCFSAIISGNTGKIALQPALESGIYILVISGKKQTVRKKIIFR